MTPEPFDITTADDDGTGARDTSPEPDAVEPLAPEPEAAKSEPAQLEAAAPDAVKSDAAQPFAAQPEVARLEAAHPQPAEIVTPQAEPAESVAAHGEAPQREAAHAEAAHPAAPAEPVAAQGEPAGAVAAHGEAPQPEAALPEAPLPEAAQAEAAQAEAAQAEAAQTEAAHPAAPAPAPESDAPEPDQEQDQAQDPDEDGEEAIRTLLWTAATERPVPEVAALVARLNESGELSRPADLALRAAAVSRPLEEVRQLVVLLNEAGYDLHQAETTLRAAAVGRPIEDIVALVNIIGADSSSWRAVGGGEDPTRPTLEDARPAAAAASGAERPPKPSRGPRTSARSPLDHALAAGPGSHTSSPALRSPLRWPAAAALFACGLIHLPTDVEGLRSGANASLLSVVVTLFCLVAAAWLAARDSATAWAATAAGTVGLLAVHVLAGARTVDVLQGSLGSRFVWAQSLAVLSCAAVVALAALTLFRHTKATGAADGT
ncbi:hypothetical protein [Streptomyces sp. NPDC127114]|uniref:hypothetical protein n=1 Tax=Streptomyces sp. NPDC127114 TaxID=3345366 RepID=UPI00362F98CE